MTEPAIITLLRRANPVKRLGEGSWIAEDCQLNHRTVNDRFMVWVPIGEGHVLRYLDRSYSLRVR